MADTTTTLREAATKALEALESLQGGCTDSGDGTTEAITVWCPEVITALRAALAEQAEPVAVPAGYALVPVEPTEAMLAAAHEGDRQYTLRNFGDVMTVMQGPYDHWHAMIAAAPPAPARQEWQPIETAPRDGFMLVHEDGAIRALLRANGVWHKCGYPALIASPWGDALVGEDARRLLPSGFRLEIRDGCCENPTHWMPLPAAPITAAPAEGGAA